jgi:putative phosphoesterase
MSKTAFISDIHGNYPALEAVLNDIDGKGIKSVICLGDVVGYYSMINEVIEVLRKRRIPTIMGNHDYAMAFADGVIDRSKTCTNVLKKQLTYISHENVDFVKKLPHEYLYKSNNSSFYCVHGGLKDQIDEYLFDADENYFRSNNFQYNYLVTGHTHKLINKKAGEFYHLNPGSVGQPRDNGRHAAYLIVDDRGISHLRVEYDVDKIARDMQRLNFGEYIYKGLYTGKKIG